jgi:hypothetical protein
MYNYIIGKSWACFDLHTNFHSYEWKMSRENINHIVIKKSWGEKQMCSDLFLINAEK